MYRSIYSFFVIQHIRPQNITGHIGCESHITVCVDSTDTWSNVELDF